MGKEERKKKIFGSFLRICGNRLWSRSKPAAQSAPSPDPTKEEPVGGQPGWPHLMNPERSRISTVHRFLYAKINRCMSLMEPLRAMSVDVETRMRPLTGRLRC
jgi:hypothetical protein